ncbi:hypothetical protein N658DRAFT_495788 [Parathielavia hyrcaniae]|uniref:Uncharacterized protein n=1 Tax=Parathielavia hyrcaniae TaxID=113614 RepID=A0AAN6Q416_9PEZI|nr:hypothetical protein N658DRAFT_495788 [Parathielavia hyrcaniae]
MDNSDAQSILDSSGMLPSYQDATTRPDWLEIVAPYIPIRQYASLCLVSKRFFHHFAPRLWNDPMAVLCLLHSDYMGVVAPQRFLGFMDHAARIPETSSLPSFARSFDTRRLFGDTSYFIPATLGTKPLSTLLSDIACRLPRLRCIFLDGYPSLEPEPLMNRPSPPARLSSAEPPLILSIARCEVELPPLYFTASYLRNLVYLDVSYMPGSLKTYLAFKKFGPTNLPSLRILKAQGREMDNGTARLLFTAFRDQLWSVDLSRNRLTDYFVDNLPGFAFSSESPRLRSSEIEGTLQNEIAETDSFGRFCFVLDSEFSASFSHPDRHFLEPPEYEVDPEDQESTSHSGRLDGRKKIYPDSPDALKTMFSGKVGFPSPPLDPVLGSPTFRAHQGITHLHLNGNMLSASALAKMIRKSKGQLQHLDCDSMRFNLPSGAVLSWLDKVNNLSGTLGWAHVFRPLFSANLQVLRIHHSLVTQLLSLEATGLSRLANLWLAETKVLPRAELAYPEAFVPDMNPRLQSLTLTRIPRYSTGPLIRKLINFLKLAAMQERAIQGAKVRAGRRHRPVTLLGLRHICLEFEPDPRERSEVGLDFDAAAIMDDSSQSFSFFESGWSSSSSTTQPSATQPSSTDPSTTQTSSLSTVSTPIHPPPVSESRDTTSQSARPDLPPAPRRRPAPSHFQSHSWDYDRTRYTRKIWIGPDPWIDPDPGEDPLHHAPAAREYTPAAREYMRLLRAHARQLQTNPSPATPCHVAAGVPKDEYVFSAAWEAILHPCRCGPSSLTGTIEPRPGGFLVSNRPSPTLDDLKGMKNVVDALKAYRAWTRRAYAEACERAREAGEQVELGEPHFHYTGRLQVVTVGGGEMDGFGSSRGS